MISLPKENLRNLVLEGWSKPPVQLCLPARMGGERNIRCGINRPSETGFLTFRLDAVAQERLSKCHPLFSVSSRT